MGHGAWDKLKITIPIDRENYEIRHETFNLLKHRIIITI